MNGLVFEHNFDFQIQVSGIQMVRAFENWTLLEKIIVSIRLFWFYFVSFSYSMFPLVHFFKLVVSIDLFLLSKSCFSSNGVYWCLLLLSICDVIASQNKRHRENPEKVNGDYLWLVTICSELHCVRHYLLMFVVALFSVVLYFE